MIILDRARWELETAEGVITGGPANPQARVARFDVGEGFAVADIEAVRITQALAPYPVQAEFALSSDFPSVEVYPGVTMRLRNVSDQGASHIVQVEVDEADHERTGFFVTGGGPGWRSAVFAAEGDPVVNLTWVGGELPDPIPLTAIGTVWVELDGGFALTLDATTAGSGTGAGTAEEVLEAINGAATVLLLVFLVGFGSRDGDVGPGAETADRLGKILDGDRAAVGVNDCPRHSEA